MNVYTSTYYEIIEHELGGYIYFTVEFIDPCFTREVAYP
jgi:hypothetical protein